MQQWTAIQILTQVAAELGLPRPASVVGTDVQSQQLLGALNAGGNELLTYYPWAFLSKDWSFATIQDQANYDLPEDWSYFVDQTQWDSTNRWPLLGPKSPQEWAWLRGGMVASAPRLRYRVRDGQFQLWPIPVAGSDGSFSPYTLTMEYVKDNWVDKGGGSEGSMIDLDGDIAAYNPWLLIKYTKYKFYISKGFADAAKEAQSNFLRMFDSLTGKDVGAGILSMSPVRTPQFLGINNIPDGNWN